MFGDQLHAALKAQTKTPPHTKPRKGGKSGSNSVANNDGPGARDARESEEHAAEEEGGVREEQVMEQLTRVLREARAAYTVRSQLQEVEGGADGRWGVLAEQFRELRVGKEVMQLAVHRQVWCRVAIESLPPEHRDLGAHQRCAHLRWCLAVLLHGRDHHHVGRKEEEDVRTQYDGQDRDAEGVLESRVMVLSRAPVCNTVSENTVEYVESTHARSADEASAEPLLTEFVQWGGDFRRHRIAWDQLPHLPALPPLPASLPALHVSASALEQYRQMGQDWRRLAFLRIVISRHSLGDANADESCVKGSLASAPAGGSHDEGTVAMEVERGSSMSALAGREGADAMGAEDVAEEEWAEVRKKMGELDPDVVVLCCALWLVVHSHAGGGRCVEHHTGTRQEHHKGARPSSISHHEFSALAALVSFPREAFPAWLEASVSKEAQAEAGATEHNGVCVCGCVGMGVGVCVCTRGGRAQRSRSAGCSQPECVFMYECGAVVGECTE